MVKTSPGGSRSTTSLTLSVTAETERTAIEIAKDKSQSQRPDYQFNLKRVEKKN
jgi:hypothetical protein